MPWQITYLLLWGEGIKIIINKLFRSYDTFLYHFNKNTYFVLKRLIVPKILWHSTSCSILPMGHLSYILTKLKTRLTKCMWQLAYMSPTLHSGVKSTVRWVKHRHSYCRCILELLSLNVLIKAAPGFELLPYSSYFLDFSLFLGFKRILVGKKFSGNSELITGTKL